MQLDVELNDCAIKMSEFLNDPVKGSIVLRDSSKFINTLGHFDKCNKNEGFKYFLVEFTIDQSIITGNVSLNFGLCAADVCTQTTATSMLKEAFNSFGFPLVSYVNAYDPVTEAEKYHIGVGGYIFGIITTLAILTGIIGSFVERTALFNLPGVKGKAPNDKELVK
jgi:hypothetical protein